MATCTSGSCPSGSFTGYTSNSTPTSAFCTCCNLPALLALELSVLAVVSQWCLHFQNRTASIYTGGICTGVTYAVSTWAGGKWYWW